MASQEYRFAVENQDNHDFHQLDARNLEINNRFIIY